MVIGDIQLKTSESIAEEARPHLTPIHHPSPLTLRAT